MKTVKELKKELDKFNDDDTCYCYEGEVTGIAINRKGYTQQGFIYCEPRHRKDKETEILFDYTIKIKLPGVVHGVIVNGVIVNGND